MPSNKVFVSVLDNFELMVFSSRAGDKIRFPCDYQSPTKIKLLYNFQNVTVYFTTDHEATFKQLKVQTSSPALKMFFPGLNPNPNYYFRSIIRCQRQI